MSKYKIITGTATVIDFVFQCMYNLLKPCIVIQLETIDVAVNNYTESG